MSGVSLHDLDQVATKGDLEIGLAGLRAEIAELRSEMHADIGALRRTTSNWMLTLLVTIVGSMIGVGLLT